MKGKDGRIHSLTLEAASLFDAASKAVRQWALFWWYDPQASLTVQSCDERWTVKQEGVRKWQDRQQARPKKH